MRLAFYLYYISGTKYIYINETEQQKEVMRKIRNTKYSYMAGSRQHLTCSFVRACLRCLPLVDTDVLLLLYVPAAAVAMVLLLYCGWLWCCHVATTAALVHGKNSRNIHTYTQRKREHGNTKKSVESKRKAGTVPQVTDGGGVQLGTSERPGRCHNRARSEKKI